MRGAVIAVLLGLGVLLALGPGSSAKLDCATGSSCDVRLTRSSVGDILVKVDNLGSSIQPRVGRAPDYISDTLRGTDRLACDATTGSSTRRIPRRGTDPGRVTRVDDSGGGTNADGSGEFYGRDRSHPGGRGGVSGGPNAETVTSLPSRVTPALLGHTGVSGDCDSNCRKVQEPASLFIVGSGLVLATMLGRKRFRGKNGSR